MRPHRLEIEAFGAFAQRQVIDFDRLAEEGLFLIHGRTGAGKTTLLDAIVFALFGEVGSRGTDRLASHHVEVGTQPMVSLEFSVGDRRYRVTRSPSYDKPRRGGGFTTKSPQGTLVRLDGDDEVALSSRTSEVSEHIKELIGLTSDQFTQVMLLPQGRFEQVLRAKSDERQKLLDTLFDTSLYRKATLWLEDRAREASNEAEAGGRHLDTLLTQAQHSRARVLEQLPELRLTEAPESGGDLAWLDTVGAELDDAFEAGSAALANVTAQHNAALASLSDARVAVQRWDEVAAATARLEELNAAQASIDELTERLRVIDAALAVRDELIAERRAIDAEADADRAFARAAERLATALTDAATVDPSFATHASSVVAVGIGDATLDRVTLQSTAIAGDVASARVRIEQRAALTNALRQANAACERAEAAVAAAVESEAEASARIETLDEWRATLTDQAASHGETAALIDQRRQAVLDLDRRREAAAEVEQLDQRLVSALDDERAAIDRHQAATETLQSLRSRYLDGIAAELAAALVDGAACAVCGSTDHPAPARLTASSVRRDDVEAAESQVAALLTARAAAADAVHGLRAQRAGHVAVAGPGASVASLADEQAVATKLLRDSEDALHAAGLIAGQLTQLAAELDDATAAKNQAAQHSAGARSALAETTRQRDDAERELSGLGDAPRVDGDEALRLLGALDETLAAWRSAADSLTAWGVARVEAEAAADAAIASSSFDDRDTPIALLTDYRNCGETRDDWFAQINQHQHDRASVEAILAKPYATALPTERPSIDAAQSLVDETTAVMNAARDRVTHLQSAVEDIATFSARYVERSGEFEELKRRAGVLNQLAARIGGKTSPRISLQRWVLRSFLDEICAYANQRLTTMTAGRYRLEVKLTPARGNAQSGLDLNVFDAHTSQTRDVSTLSGGETFQASLALALGVADTVSAHHGGVRLDALFVDEGFGSLDPESLQLAMDELDRLREGGRMVGLISHVGALRERIAYGVEVTAGTNGSRATLGPVAPV